ncbi:hypothetical protein [Rubrivivax rivuli]|uniref:Uncharacterized protein n=1 Tax=Rubrivivax rivuli TaxID=1862385 RepID=A0A437RKJ8_9BURK|nr:hypothetical protein [Rubrivivax rivuli]RVU47155.1 hypothetical protein EOE66_05180 [Rubrivivax rivuli]
MPTDPQDAARHPSPPDAREDTGPPLSFSASFVRWHVALSVAIAAVASGVLWWPQGWPLEGRGHVHTALLLLVSASLYIDWRVGLLGLTPHQIYLCFRQPGSLLHRWCGRLHNLALVLFLAAALTHSCTG